MSPPRPAMRSPLRSVHNTLPLVEEDSTPKAQERALVAKAVTPPRPPSPPSRLSPQRPATAGELAEADAALHAMELSQSKNMSKDCKKQLAPADDGDSSSSSEEDEPGERRWSTSRRSSAGKPAGPAKGKGVKVSKEAPAEEKRRSSGGRRGSLRRDSMQHLTRSQLAAMRRLSDILRDNGQERRAQERRDSLVRVTKSDALARDARRLSAKKQRVQSIAKMIDLAQIWEWLEHCDEDDFDDLHVQTQAELKALDIEETDSECSERDAAATAIVLDMTRRGGDLDRAMASELGLEFEDEPSKAPTVFELLRTCAKPVSVVASYELKRGFYVVHVHFPNNAHALQIERSWNDLRRLRRGLVEQLPSSCKLAQLPKARAFSVAKNIFRTMTTASSKKSDRLWQQSKISHVEAWLAHVSTVVHADAAAQPRQEDGQASCFQQFEFAAQKGPGARRCPGGHRKNCGAVSAAVAGRLCGGCGTVFSGRL
ncbi:hypothetical protein M885DRAFT_532608 [Pelagophyceae sp. CCMP2097]|nr:hypothetical protein M885DRAFT_532608 [Pelagophyceae sp. CCMP2097]